MTDTQDLLTRLQEADGPSRELDAEIAQAKGWLQVKQGFTNMNGSTEATKLWRSPDTNDDDWRQYVDELRPEIANGFWPDCDPPAYTASIDAALTLVPEGWWPGFQCQKNSGVPDRERWSVWLEPTDGIGSASHANTLALAICIATLKATKQ